jgi:hypothetical protein
MFEVNVTRVPRWNHFGAVVLPPTAFLPSACVVHRRSARRLASTVARRTHVGHPALPYVVIREEVVIVDPGAGRVIEVVD